jgi:hypothetical protein
MKWYKNTFPVVIHSGGGGVETELVTGLISEEAPIIGVCKNADVWSVTALDTGLYVFRSKSKARALNFAERLFPYLMEGTKEISKERRAVLTSIVGQLKVEEELVTLQPVPVHIERLYNLAKDLLLPNDKKNEGKLANTLGILKGMADNHYTQHPKGARIGPWVPKQTEIKTMAAELIDLIEALRDKKFRGKK